jgi:serine/threonine-protein kinase
MTAGQLRNGHVLAGRYRVEALIGRGGMAEVYRGVDIRLARPIAIKVLRAHYAPDPELRRRFEEEARAAAMLSHPNVVAVYDAGEDESTAFIVMELVPGDSLADRIARGPLDEATVRRIGGEVLDAVAAAHARSLLHRDIKPANVLLTGDGIAKVADFGIAKALHPSPDRSEPTAMHLVLGTPSYLAPERAQGNPATVRSDQWSVGVLLYESVTGQKPFDGDTPIAIALAAMAGRYQPVLDRRPDIDPSLAAVIDRALQVDPASRFASAEEMGHFLRTPAADATAAFPTTPFDPDATTVLGSPTATMVLGAGGLGAGVLGAGVAGAGVLGAGVAGAGALGAGVAGAGVAGAGVAGAGALGAGVAGAGVAGAGALGAGGFSGGRGPAAAGGDPMSYGATTTGEGPTSRRQRRYGAPIIAAAAVLVVVVGLGGWLLASHHPPSTTVPPNTSQATSTISKPSTTTTLSPTSTTTPPSSTTTSSSTSTTSTTLAPTSTTTSVASSTTTAPATTTTTSGASTPTSSTTASTVPG